MSEHNLNSLDLASFMWIAARRESAISSVEGKTVRFDNEANQLAEKLHPKVQHMMVADVTDLSTDTKCFTLVPNAAFGNTGCAYFSAGQYVSVSVSIEGKEYSRPYSICSSPKEALQGRYQIAVKAVENGLVSNYIYTKWNVGTPVSLSAPTGNFVYEPLRDANTIVGIAGGSGITPFLSLARAIEDGIESCSLRLFYGCRTQKDILFKSELDELQRKSSKIKVVYVLSEEDTENFEHGFITYDQIAEHIPDTSEVSYFICGPSQLYQAIESDLLSHHIEPKKIRCETHLKSKIDREKKKISVRVRQQNEIKEVSGNTTQTILEILENAGFAPESRCRSGECGFCRSRLISGEICIAAEDDARRKADVKHNIIHPCCTYPVSDVEIELLR